MGKNDSLSTNEARFLPQARFFVAYTAREPEKLPSGVTELRKEGLTDRYSVGACFARSITYPEGVFWVLMVFYAAGAPARR
jgi:hypothetical protein